MPILTRFWNKRFQWLAMAIFVACNRNQLILLFICFIFFGRACRSILRAHIPERDPSVVHHRPDAVPRVGRDAARRERAHPRRAGPHAGLAARHCARALRPGRHRMRPFLFRSVPSRSRYLFISHFTLEGTPYIIPAQIIEKIINSYSCIGLIN